MAVRPRLVRSIPFWILLVGSLASVAAGVWLVVDKITLMNATLLDGTATGVEVYGGQAWVTLGAALVGAGLVGLVSILFLAVLRSFVPKPAVEVVEAAEWTADDAEPVVAPVAEPVVAPVAEPALESTDAAPADLTEPAPTR